MRTYFPEIEPYKTDFLAVSNGHRLYYEEVGNPSGVPIVFLHGGPGAGISAKHRRFYDPKHYRIILFDQRGSGKSTPFASLDHNTTWDIVEDMETLRKHLQIDQWIVFGGSWGSTLALAYAETHTENVMGLILRGIFLLRPEEIYWFYQEGASYVYPDLWEEYLKPIPPSERGDLVSAYHKRLTSKDESVRLEAAKAWSIWEGSTATLLRDPNLVEQFGGDMALSLARIECHYFMNDGFLDNTDFLLENAHKLKNIPAVIVHGRYDMVCPVKNAFDLHRVWPEAKLHIIPDAGHAVSEPGIIDALIQATEDFKSLGNQKKMTSQHLKPAQL